MRPPESNEELHNPVLPLPLLSKMLRSWGAGV